ncbi:MAG: hypothetical protein AAFR46_16915 [Pseudomonadota bacterium]
MRSGPVLVSQPANDTRGSVLTESRVMLRRRRRRGWRSAPRILISVVLTVWIASGFLFIF